MIGKTPSIEPQWIDKVCVYNVKRYCVCSRAIRQTIPPFI